MCIRDSDKRDLQALIDGVSIVRKLTKTDAFSTICGDEIFPGSNINSIDDLSDEIRKNLYTQWHLSGTAAMGPESDSNSVVDNHGKVYGVNKLRVVDASIMPTVTNGNTNSPTIMIAEKMSDHILGKKALKKMNKQIWNPNQTGIQE